MTAGAASSHGKFFGSGNQKAELAPLADMKKIASGPGADKKGTVTAMLNNTLAQSKLAAKAGDLGASRNTAGNPFGGSSKGAASDLRSTAQQSDGPVDGLAEGQSAGNLKTNDPNLNKNKITPPAVTPPKEVKDPNEELKQMVIKMIFQAALGMIFS